MDKQHAQAIWTWMMHSNSEWTCNMSMQHAQAARTSSRDNSIRIDLFFISLSLTVLYCPILLSTVATSNINTISALQRKVIRIITKSHSRADTTPIFKNLQILPFN
jgi:hypothetical protein